MFPRLRRFLWLAGGKGMPDWLVVAGWQEDEEEMAQSEVRGSCHCGAVTIRVPHPPEWVGSCNCSLCSKTGWLVANAIPSKWYFDGAPRA